MIVNVAWKYIKLPLIRELIRSTVAIISIFLLTRNIYSIVIRNILQLSCFYMNFLCKEIQLVLFYAINLY